MVNEFNVACPSCSAVFSVPTELAGEMAECAECGAVFEIPHPPEAENQQDAQEKGGDDTQTGAITGLASDGEGVTNTVRLSRTSIGMIPKVKEAFTFNEAPGPGGRPQAQAPARPAAPKPAMPAPNAAQVPRVAAPPPAAPPPPPPPAAAPAAESAEEKAPGKKKIAAGKSRVSINVPKKGAAPAAAPAPAPAAAPLMKQPVEDDEQEQVEEPEAVEANVSGRSDKDIGTAFALCFFFGWLGLHRFFVGKTGSAVGMLCCLGGFGIWSIIDLFMIANGKFTDKEGLPLKN